MPRTRVLIVDDSVVIRRLVQRALGDSADIEVVGAAANGRIALQRVPQLNPDVVVLDVEMPDMNGLETLSELRKTHPRLPVIMFSSLTERGASVTLEALSRGASDYVTKPASTGSLSASTALVRDELSSRIRALAPLPPPAPLARPCERSAQRARLAPGAVDVVAIGASTGGPNALAEVFTALPRGFATPILVVQHMPPIFTRLLAERLSARSSVVVREGFPGAEVLPGTAWVAPGDFHMTVRREGTRVILDLDQAPPENSCRPAVDVMFRSVAATFGGNTLAIVLTGMGQDGLRGVERLSELGATIVAQDEATSVVWGMPGFVARSGLSDAVLPLSEIAGEIERRTHRLRPGTVPTLAVRASG